MIRCFIVISNGNWTEWSRIRSVIIRVIGQKSDDRARESDLLITSMITDRIGRHIKIAICEKRIAKLWKKIRLKIPTKEIKTF